MSLDEKRNGLDAQPGTSTSNYLLIGDSAYGYTFAATIPAIGLFGDFDAYALRVDPGFSYTIGSYSAFPLYTPNPFNTNFAILDRFGNILALSTDTGAASFFTFTAIDSLYYVQAYSDSIGHYSLLATNNTIFENNSVGQTLSLGAALQGRLDFTSDVDRFGFSAIAGRTYAFTLLTSIPDAFLDVEYSNEFVSNLVSNGSGIYTFTAPLSGIYDLHISANRFTSRGDYSIRYVELDVTPPLISSVNPADETIGVDVARNIEVQFTEQIQRGGGTISIRAVSSNLVVETYQASTSPNLTFAGSMLTINPTANLGAGAQYRVEFSSDSVRDLAGNAYAGSSFYNFTTAMAANPTPGAIASTVKLAPSGVEIADALTNGSHWVLDVTRTVTWAVADAAASDWKWSASRAAHMRDAMTSVLANYAEVANVRFQYAGWFDDFRTAPANIVLAATEFPATLGMAGAYARAFSPYEPGSDAEIARLLGTPAAYPNASGDVLLNFTEREMSGSDYLPDSNGYFALMHEVGHALGLKHPHDNGGTAGRKTFSELGFTAADNQILTIMSYDPATSFAAWLQRFHLPADAGYPATLMPLDVLALQSIYGPNTSMRAGPTVYEVFNDDRIETFWDASGQDLLTAAGSLFGWYVFPVPSGGDQDLAVAIPRDSGALTGKFYFNVERFEGSQSADTIFGNRLANAIAGLAGNDILGGGGGNDSIDGGFGVDVAQYQSPRTNYVVQRASGGWGVADRVGLDGVDTLTNVERLQFSDTGLAIDTAPGEKGHSVALILRALYGPEALKNKLFVSAALTVMDAGYSFTDLVAAAIGIPNFEQLAGSRSNTAFVRTVYKNVVGVTPSQDDLAYFVGLLDSGVYSQVSLGVLAATVDINALSVDLVGIVQGGIDFTPT